jgi:signal transduction histidine kinase
MGKGKTLLQIIENNMDALVDRVAAEFRKPDHSSFDTFSDEDLKTLAWSHVDPIIQSLRFEDDYLFTFFLDYSSGRNAEQGLPIDDMLFTLNVVGAQLWDLVIAESPAETAVENLRRLDSILAKGKDGIAANYLKQRETLLEELRRSNERLLEMTKRKLDFLAKVSHELKTPLTSIIAYSEQLKDAGVPEQIRAEFIAVIHDQSHKLFHLIEDLLDLSKSENEPSRLNLAWADLRIVLEEAIGTVEARAAEKNITLSLSDTGELPKVYMDAFRIQQVVWNLLTNGVKYNRPGGSVKVSARHQDESVVVSVNDDGIGIKPEDQEKIFNSFHQTDDALAMYEGGAGLGLDIARHYLQIHGGSIWVESEHGVGSTFYFMLPIDGPKDMSGDQDERESAAPEREPAAARLPSREKEKAGS